MSKPETIEELNDNLDIPQFDEWAEGVLEVATELRRSDDRTATRVFEFKNMRYKVTVEEIDAVDDTTIGQVSGSPPGMQNG